MAGLPKTPVRPTATRVLLPPVSTPAGSSVSSDPNLLLDAFDAFSEGRGNNKNNKADPIDFLNKHYTSEAILVAQLPFLRDAVTDRMLRLDDTISNALQRQSESAEATQKHVQDAKASVASLEQRIQQVQQKASQSEQTVREITKDMKRLDCAKRHLQKTITTLKRLHMLIHAVEQLRLACLQDPFPDYKVASHLVDAIRLLLRHFEGFKVAPMQALSQKVTDLHGELKFCLIRAFRVVSFGIDTTLELEKDMKKSKYKTMRHLEEGETPQSLTTIMPPQVMADGILMIDALGKDARNEFITVFGQDQLAEYSRLFKPVNKKPQEQKRVSSFKIQPEPEEIKPEYTLEFIEKRFLWFRNMLNHIGEKYPAVFPNYWNIEYLLTKTFLKRTRSHLLALFNGATKDPEANNATILLKALQKTIQFEKEVSLALQREYGTIFKSSSQENTTSSSQTTTANKKSGKITPSEDGSTNASINDRASTEQEAVEPLFGVASSAFDNHMGPYIALEEQSMDEQLVMALEDRAVDTRGELPVFTTSTKLFIYIKGSISRCTALTKGNAFFLLYQAFQDSLQKYAQVLSSKLPPALPPRSGGLNLANVPFTKQQDGTSGQATTTTSYRVPPGEEVTVCHVIGTCEYCAETVEALQDLIRDTVEDQYKEKIDMMPQQEAFHEITAKAIRVLVSGLEIRLEEAYRMMTSINWAVFDEVGEESDYVRTMHREIQPYITTTRGLIPTSYFRSICDKFAMSFTEDYYNAIIRLKTISEQGSQQLLLDSSILKTLFLKLPVMEKSVPSGLTSPSSSRKVVPAGSTIAPAMYTKMVQKQFKKIEILLKLTGTPISLLIDVFRDQWPGGSAMDLQTVMSLKGMKRSDQAAMLEKFGLDPATARKGATMNVTSATIVSERLQAVQGHANKMNTDLNQMRQKVDEFRKAFR